MVHAEHNSELAWTNPASGRNETHFGGEPCGFIIQLENGFKIYHMGDTGLFGDMKMIGEYYKPDLILVPVGGGQFVMNPADAAYATKQYLKPKYALPFHYATNPFLTGTPDEYIKALGKTSTKVFAIDPGDKLEFRSAARGARLSPGRGRDSPGGEPPCRCKARVPPPSSAARCAWQVSARRSNPIPSTPSRTRFPSTCLMACPSRWIGRRPRSAPPSRKRRSGTGG
jgi:hypothetical protein